MTRFAVDVPARVRRQIFEVVSHIADDSVDSALACEARLTAALDKLGEFHGHAVDEDGSDRCGQIAHKLVFERTYLVHYRVDAAGSIVHVMNIRDGRRLPRPGEP